MAQSPRPAAQSPRPAARGALPQPNECRAVDGGEAQTLVANGALLVDVRTASEYAAGHVDGAVNLPLAELPDRLAELDASRAVVVYCQSGNRSSQAATLLCDAGYTVYDLGPMSNWSG
ncbi:MAG TPA: rhodanese-like domain-containing protein [Polyangiaceae bacterium]|nr:rhodanese-like domain-containing protein [Polyangiaceae bacterium]